MAETVFGRILRGEVHCHRIYENEHVLAFLDLFPLSLGHTLVIPKEAAETLDLLSDDSAAAIGRVLPRICRAVQGATGTKAFNVLQNNGASAHQAIAHVHFHIIPRHDDGTGLGLVWRPKQLDEQRGAALALEIARRIQT